MFKCLEIVSGCTIKSGKILGFKQRNRKVAVKNQLFKIFDDEDSEFTYCSRKQLELLSNFGIFVDNLDYDNFTIEKEYFDLNSIYFTELKQCIFRLIRNMPSSYSDNYEVCFIYDTDLEEQQILAKMLGLRTKLSEYEYCNYLVVYSDSIVKVYFNKPLILSGVDNFLSDKHINSAFSNDNFSNNKDLFKFERYSPEYGEVFGDEGKSYSEDLFIKYDLDLSDVDMSMLKDISGMFHAARVKSVKFNKTLKPKVMDRCFFSSDIESVDFASFDTSELESVVDMFAFCDFETINLEGLNLGKTSKIMGIFSFCRNLNQLDLSRLDFSSVINARDMFTYCESLTSFDTSKLNFNNLVNASSFFSNCTNLKQVDLSGLSNAIDFSDLLNSCINLETVDLTKLNLDRDKLHLGRIISRCSNLKDVKGLDYILEYKNYCVSKFELIKNLDIEKPVHLVGDCTKAFFESKFNSLHVIIDDYNYESRTTDMFSNAKLNNLTIDINNPNIILDKMFVNTSISGVLTLNINCELTKAVETLFYKCQFNKLVINTYSIPILASKPFKFCYIDEIEYNEEVKSNLDYYKPFSYRTYIGSFTSNNQAYLDYYNSK